MFQADVPGTLSTNIFSEPMCLEPWLQQHFRNRRSARGFYLCFFRRVICISLFNSIIRPLVWPRRVSRNVNNYLTCDPSNKTKLSLSASVCKFTAKEGTTITIKLSWNLDGWSLSITQCVCAIVAVKAVPSTICEFHNNKSYLTDVAQI